MSVRFATEDFLQLTQQVQGQVQQIISDNSRRRVRESESNQSLDDEEDIEEIALAIAAANTRTTSPIWMLIEDEGTRINAILASMSIPSSDGDNDAHLGTESNGVRGRRRVVVPMHSRHTHRNHQLYNITQNERGYRFIGRFMYDAPNQFGMQSEAARAQPIPSTPQNTSILPAKSKHNVALDKIKFDYQTYPMHTSFDRY